MWEFEHLTSRPGNPKANAKSESAIRNSNNLPHKVLDNNDASTWQFWTIELHRGIMAPCCQPFVHSTAACDTAVNRGICFHVETLHIIPFEACSYLLCIRDLPSRTMLSSWSFLVSFSRTEPLFVPIFKVFWIAGHNCRIWYRYQPRQCPISRVPCYRANHSPMNGLCCRCQRQGHMRPARVSFLLGLTLPDVQLLFSWGL